jgi:hypothetical protein
MKRQLYEVNALNAKESAKVFRFCGMCGCEGQFKGGLCGKCR